MELHSRRVLRIARRLAEENALDADPEILDCAALLHDIGLYDPWWCGGPYVTDGARAAETLLTPFAWGEDRLRRCCDAIERHHSPGDQSRPGPETELIRRADLVDLSRGLVRYGLSPAWLAGLFQQLPRNGFLPPRGSPLPAAVSRAPAIHSRGGSPQGSSGARCAMREAACLEPSSKKPFTWQATDAAIHFVVAAVSIAVLVVQLRWDRAAAPRAAAG